ncbi:enolase C-terminal domain-like protein [Flavobacterium sp.]|uniref:enolase C-terminal domain-like protein n=1 Tax=Flavobacterium sp. TaxID=239 RepID=UPI002B4B2C69|nr:enolase C-terminal domain-like protein [Flavobacterium sp.]HLF52659.1 enolase C-terminal domain-like protein [Flavobacterium sp.]
MVLSWQIVRFALKETFAIAYGNYSHREALLVTLTKNGISGYGECTAIDYYQINLADYSQKLHSIKAFVEKQQIIHPTDFYNFLLTLELPSFLRSALDCAYWDLFGKLENKSFLSLNAIEINELPESSITISVAPIATQLEKIAKSPWTKFKVKCNHFDENDIQLLLKTGKEVALDANGSFTKEQCQWLENFETSKTFTYIEQPMKPGAENYSSLHQNKYPNWMADEDCQENINLLSLQPHYRSINIKLVKCGGLTPALQLIKNAKSLGFKTMIGCMTESTVGISAGAVLTPLVDFVDLDGANLIANDIAIGSAVLNGKILLSENPGLGIKVL